MGNSYEGTKFRTILKEKPVNSIFSKDIIYWSHLLAKKGCAPALEGGYGGNLSLRENCSFIITASGADLRELKNEEIVKVLKTDIDNRKLVAEGMMLPSSESLLHAAVYHQRPEIMAVFHGHYPVSEENFIKIDLPITEKETEYGSIELINEILSILNDHNFILIKNHGFLSLGRTPHEAGNRILNICTKAKSITS